MIKITKIILWIVGLSLLAYFIFLPVEITREKPQKISPEEKIPLIIPEETTSTKD